MKNYFGIDCETVMDSVYHSEETASEPIFSQIKVDLHIFFCSRCYEESKKLKLAQEIMRTGFFPPAPNLEDSIMKRLEAETVTERETVLGDSVSGGFSSRTWIIIGFFMLISLSSSFFGVNFTEIANKEGLSFILPLGITIGIAVTCYGAFFIASHLKELTNRFDIH